MAGTALWIPWENQGSLFATAAMQVVEKVRERKGESERESESMRERERRKIRRSEIITERERETEI